MSFFSELFSRRNTTLTTNQPTCIVGLGNPGKKYATTRHNLGFLMIEYLQREWGGSEWHLEKKFQAEVSETNYAGRKIFLIKPQTFMNNSGRSVRALLDFYKTTPTDLIILHDEVDIPFGRIKTTLSSRAAGHNGVKDIIDKLGTQDFRRLRLGVGKSANPNISTSDHVLQPFSEDESKFLPSIFKETEVVLKQFVS